MTQFNYKAVRQAKRSDRINPMITINEVNPRQAFSTLTGDRRQTAQPSLYACNH